MMFIAIKTDDGRIKGSISFYCKMLKISREGFRKYLMNKDKPWMCEALADELKKISQKMIKCKDGKLYTSVIFDCFDLSVLGLAMDTNMKAPLCVNT